MFLYILLFAIPVIAFFYNEKATARSVPFLAGYLALLAVFVGFGDMLGGYDRYIYGEVFDVIADTTTKGGNYRASGSFDLFEAEKGYTWYNIVVSWFTANRYIFILVTTFIVYGLLFVSLKRYAANYPLALMTFMGLWFFFTFTYLRQVLGATIAWLAVRYVIERKMWKYLAVWFVAWCFHKSAIVFLPLYFVPVRKFPPILVRNVMIGMAILGLSPIPNAFFSFYTDNSVVEQQSDYGAEGGIRVAYVIEAVFFLYLILANYRHIPRTRAAVVMLNMALVFCAMLLFFVRSENGGRLSWYYMIGVIVTVVQILYPKFVTSRVRQLRQFIPVVMFFLFFRILNAWGMQLYPYKTFLSDGYRRGDPIWEEYEYNHGYDMDKFCRPAFRVKINAGNGNIFGGGNNQIKGEKKE